MSSEDGRSPLQQALWMMQATFAAAILGMVFFAPPLLFLAAVFTQPLWTTETVTYTATVPGGAIGTAGPLLLVWGLLVLTAIFAEKYGMRSI